MDWVKLFYVGIIVLLYIPMVFLGANVFFPDYTGSDSHYKGYSDCYMKYSYPPEPVKMTDAQRIAFNDAQRKCQEENNFAQSKWESEKFRYEGTKYVFISLFNLLILLVGVFAPRLHRLHDTVLMGLFIGSMGATFGGTIRYFDSRSKLGFVILVLTFVFMLFFVNRKKDSFVKCSNKKK